MYYFLFSFFIAVGFFLSYQYGKSTSEFKWSEYFATLILPFIGLGLLVWQEGANIFWYYIICCFAGNLVEHIGGFSLHKILGHRLWVYHRLTGGGTQVYYPGHIGV